MMLENMLLVVIFNERLLSMNTGNLFQLATLIHYYSNCFFKIQYSQKIMHIQELLLASTSWLLLAASYGQKLKLQELLCDGIFEMQEPLLVGFSNCKTFFVH